MAIEVNFKKTYIVNSKEYHSFDEMPEDIRQTFQKTMADERHKIDVNTDTNITFNGKNYKEIDEMPGDVRRSYEELMKALGLEKLSSTSDFVKSLISPEMKIPNPQPKALTFETSFSPRSLIIVTALIILALVAYLYF